MHCRNELRAARILQGRLFKQANIDIFWNYGLVEVIASATQTKGMAGVRLHSAKEDILEIRRLVPDRSDRGIGNEDVAPPETETLMIDCMIQASPVAAEISVPESSQTPKNGAINTVSCDKTGPDRAPRSSCCK